MAKKVPKNTETTESGIEIYADDIHYFADDYINHVLVDTYGTDDAKNMIFKPPVFRGLLKHIYVNVFRIRPGDIKYNNKNSRIDYSDIDLLNKLWDIYTDLCYKYLQIPTILNYCMMTGIDPNTMDTWRTGEYRSNIDGKMNNQYSNFYEKCLRECEAALVDGAGTGNPGPMFLLKAKYGYVEQAQKLEIVNNGPAISMAELKQLRERKRGELPAPPEDDD